ncbi:MAG: hypothetical protein M3280_12420 [Actinomycetota bacterium]|nr:hypothetical protein [Actinomycetota bacterium]
MDLKRLSKGESLLAVAALLLFVLSLFQAWGSQDVSTDVFKGFPEEAQQEIDARFSQEIADYSIWSGYGLLPKLGVLIGLLLLLLVIAKAAGALDEWNMPVPLGLVYLGGGVVVLVSMLVALLAGPEGDNRVTVRGTTFVQNRGVLVFVGVLLGIAIAAGGFLHRQEEVTTPGARRRPGPPPPPAP